MERIKLDVSYDEKSDPLHVRFLLHLSDPTYAGKSADFELHQKFTVLDDSPVHSERRLFKQRVTLALGDNEIVVPKANLLAFSFRGKMLDISLSAILNCENFMLHMEQLSSEKQIQLSLKPQVKGNAQEEIDPKDAFNFIRNFMAISPHRRLIVLALLIVGGILMVANSAIGLHDQLSPEAQTILYSHTDSDGDSQSPLVGALIGSGFMGFMVWLAIRHQLKQYMTFQLGRIPVKLNRGTSISVASLIRGRSRINIPDAILRVVACNFECGQYIRGSGTNRRTVSFREPFRAVVLFEQKLNIQANVPLLHQLRGEFSLLPMFDILYPPQMHNGTHGIDVVWEVQLLHDLYIDQELVLANANLPYIEFLYQSQTEAEKHNQLLNQVFPHV